MRRRKVFLLLVIMLICHINIIIVEASEDLNTEKKEETIENKEFKIKEGEEETSPINTDIDEPEQENNTDAELIEGQENKKDETKIEEAVEIEETEGIGEAENEPTKEDQEKDYIYNVSFPTDSKAYLDPENLSGKGQIFSNEFKVENYGNTDIAIKIKNIEVNYRTTEDLYELSEDEIIDKRSHVKKLNVDMIWKNEKENTEKLLHVVEGAPDEYVLSLMASEYDENGCFVEVNEGSVGSFYFTGTLSSNPEIDWKNGEIEVSFEYEVVMSVEESEEAQETINAIELMDNHRDEEEEN